jgi:hypothetical protein
MQAPQNQIVPPKDLGLAATISTPLPVTPLLLGLDKGAKSFIPSVIKAPMAGFAVPNPPPSVPHITIPTTPIISVSNQ